ncbi:MAG: helix-turn-helix domain-containing protein [Clostridiales bacterium]|nr:helix-turn-helix domain-containing protein [Clostridiales bacterium]
MEKNYMNPNAVVEFEFLEEPNVASHSHENPEILFVLEGKLHVKADQREYDLLNEDFLLINANRPHSCRTERKFFAVRFQLSMNTLRELLQRNSILFWCSSVFDQSKSCKEVRRLLQNILFCNVNKGTKDKFYEKSLHYQLLSLLCGEFLLESKEAIDATADKGDHMSQLLDYIRANYKNRISLQDAADELYLSPTYLSKYIRKNSGQGFVELINSIRLSHALEDLMYTDAPIIKIAMDNGFASVAALNKIFKETYDTTPSAYRKKRKTKSDNSAYMQKTAAVLRQYLDQEDHTQERQEVSMSLPPDEYRPMTLQSLMNAGQAEDLLKATTQDRILYCKRKLGIKYIRFWNVFVSDMHLNRNAKSKQFNYGRLDEILDFLVRWKLHPYIELRSKSLRLLQTADKIVHEREHTKDFQDQEELSAFFRSFFSHLVRRYGREEVNTWMFSYCIETDTRFEGKHFSCGLIDEQMWNVYLEEFDIVAGALKERFPDAKIGGPGFSVQHYQPELMGRFLFDWKIGHVPPDFISVTSFPYQLVQEEGEWYEKRRTDFNFVKDDVDAVKAAMDAAGFGEKSLHLTECNLTLSDRNYINDSVIRAAFVANTVAQLYDKVDLFGIWNTLDSYSEYSDSLGYLFGGSGILTKTGIAKPACFVLYFVNRLYKESAMEKDGLLLTANSDGHYKLLVHSLANMNTAYYLKEEDQLPAMGIEQMVEASERKVIHVRIDNVADGCWQIRRYQLNRDSGSILNEWLNFEVDTELRMEEMNYLERVFPRIFIHKQYAEKNALEFDIGLEPNEVQYLHITEFN